MGNQDEAFEATDGIIFRVPEGSTSCGHPIIPASNLHYNRVSEIDTDVLPENQNRDGKDPSTDEEVTASNRVAAQEAETKLFFLLA